MLQCQRRSCESNNYIKNSDDFTLIPLVNLFLLEDKRTTSGKDNAGYKNSSMFKFWDIKDGKILILRRKRWAMGWTKVDRFAKFLTPSTVNRFQVLRVAFFYRVYCKLVRIFLHHKDEIRVGNKTYIKCPVPRFVITPFGCHQEWYRLLLSGTTAEK